MKPKPIPRDLTFEGLFFPNREHVYLEHAESHPFESTTEFRVVNAWWLAELSLLSYVQDEAFARTALSRMGDAELIERDGMAALILHRDEHDLVAFRGTDDLQDLLRDLDVRLVEEGPGKVHRGFRDALDLVWNEIRERLEQRPVWLSGHSLGAALAVIAASRLDSAQAVYTFGAPRIADRAFGDSMTVPTYRVVNNNDIVTRMPPPIAYQHFGQLEYFDRDGVLRSEPGLWERVREQAAGHGERIVENVKRTLAGELKVIPYDSLIDHSPLHYAVHLWNELRR